MDPISEDKQTVQCTERPQSTAQTLAPELLCEIFMHCLPDRTPIRRLSNPPWLFGRICRSWRVVSLSSSELWSSFAIRGYSLKSVDVEKDLEAAKYWISKSGSRPLSIDIYYPSYCPYEVLRPILECLVSQSRRWKEIELTVPPECKDIVHAPFRTGNLPQLVRFESTTIGGNSSTEFILSSAPRLQLFYHHGYRTRVDFSGRTYDIKQIRVDCSRNSRISLTDLFTCFTHCPLLEDIAIPIGIGEWKTSLLDDIPSIVELSHLTHMFLLCTSGVEPGHLFGRLFLPVLTCLELQMGVSDTDHTDWPHIRTMLAHSRPPLQTLHLWCVPIAEVTLVECLSYIPTLVDLELKGIVVSDRIPDSLTVDEADIDGSKSLCPWLELADFGDEWDVIGGEGPFSARSMTAMIVSRWKNAKNSGFTKGKALALVRCPFDFDSIRSHPDIAECLKDGLVLMGDD